MHREPPQPLPAAPSSGLLEGLARLHPALLVVDSTERVVWMSDQFGSLCGVEGEHVGRVARELFGAGHKHDGLARKFADQGHLTNEALDLLRGDGSCIPVELSALRVPVSCDAGAYAVAIVRPQESAREAGGEGDRSAESLRAILESSSEPVLAVDRQGFVTYANPALEQLLEVDRADLLQRPLALFFAKRDTLGQLGAVASALDPRHGSASRSIELLRSDGVRYVEVSASPLRLSDGSHAGTVAFLRDVTEARRFEQALERKNAELEHYVHAVSHDLRTPLVSLLGFSRLLAQDYGDVLNETGRHFLERIEQASRTMEDLINDLLELSRIGQANGERAWIDPLGVLKQIAAELKPRLEERGIELALPTSPPAVLCVRTQLYQVFANLIGNAIDHMGDPDSPRIAVEIREEGDRHVLGVRDNGVGLPHDQQDRLFEIFHTLGRRPCGRKGTGIGLAIVKKVAEAHGGRAWVESSPGRGSRFLVSLPRS